MTKNKIYRITYNDHFSTDSISLREARIKRCIMVTYGKFIGETNEYIILTWNHEDEGDENNDNMHILKKGIISMEELYEDLS